MSLQLKTDPDSDFYEEKDTVLCHICTDTATGRHYGAIACNGCKGFFRRTVRRAYEYKCRFDSKCKIDKHNRAVCRYCRYMKCIRSGMRDDQVQMERDVIGKRVKGENNKSWDDKSPRTSPELNKPNWNEHEYLLNCLLRSESTIHSLRDTVIKQIGNVEYTTKDSQSSDDANNTDTASLNDVLKSMHSQLLLVIEWAKTLPEFTQLSSEDQTILLKNFAGQHVTLCVAYRSRESNDVLKLLNDRCIPRASKSKNGKETVDGFYLRDCEKVMDQLVAPMRFLNMDDTEFVALKACILFNPVARGLSKLACQKILETRRKVFSALEQYIRKNKPTETTRLGDLTFFILSPLSVLSQTISEDIMFTKMCGAARIDMLMEELILAESGYNHHIRPHVNPSMSHEDDSLQCPPCVDLPHHQEDPTMIPSTSVSPLDNIPPMMENDIQSHSQQPHNLPWMNHNPEYMPYPQMHGAYQDLNIPPPNYVNPHF